MLCWVLVERIRHEYMSDEYKNRYTLVLLLCCRSPHLESIGPTRDHRTLVSTELNKGVEVKWTNTDLPNTCRRSTTETIMHSVGQNILPIFPHFGIDFLQPPRSRNSEDSETAKLDYFLSFQMVNVPLTGKCISSLAIR